jgi:hypothetical protein
MTELVRRYDMLKHNLLSWDGADGCRGGAARVTVPRRLPLATGITMTELMRRNDMLKHNLLSADELTRHNDARAADY